MAPAIAALNATIDIVTNGLTVNNDFNALPRPLIPVVALVASPPKAVIVDVKSNPFRTFTISNVLVILGINIVKDIPIADIFSMNVASSSFNV